MIALQQVRRALLVVAHPDDETLWAGGLLIHTRSFIAWTVLVCSIPKRDPERIDKCAEACGVLHATLVALPTQEPGALLPLTLPARYSFHDYNMIVTHGKDGEYGHLHHRQVHQWVRHLAEGQQVPAVTIGYKPKGRGEFVLYLTDSERNEKLRALQCYDHVLPFRGKRMPKWEALLANYGDRFKFDVESYDGMTLT